MIAGDEALRRENNMDAAECEAALQQLAESRERLLRMAEDLSREQWHYRPAPDRWTVAECVEHIVTVEARILGRIHKALERGPDPAKRSAMEGQEVAFFAGAEARATRLQAPEVLVPTGRWPGEQLLQEFEAARRQTREFVASTQADLRRHFFKHPVFGELDSYQWLLLIVAHCDRHRAQSEEVIASPGFPRARGANAPA